MPFIFATESFLEISFHLVKMKKNHQCNNPVQLYSIPYPWLASLHHLLPAHTYLISDRRKSILSPPISILSELLACGQHSIFLLLFTASTLGSDQLGPDSQSARVCAWEPCPSTNFFKIPCWKRCQPWDLLTWTIWFPVAANLNGCWWSLLPCALRLDCQPRSTLFKRNITQKSKLWSSSFILRSLT